jgi:hypothetical protein
MNIAEFLSSVEVKTGQSPKKNGNGWTSPCPAHPDKKPSLSISEDRGKILVHCHAGCTAEAVVASLGLKLADLMPPKERIPRREVAAYDYRDTSGNLLHQTIRYEPKDFRQRRPDPDKPGQFIWSLKGIGTVLYHLPELEQARFTGETIFIVEGEKDADAMAEHGFCATCNPMGAEKWEPQYTESLQDSDCIIIPDKDTSGLRHLNLVGSKLTDHVKRLRVINLPDIGKWPVKDPADFFAAGGTADQLHALADAAPEWAPPADPETPPPEPPQNNPDHRHEFGALAGLLNGNSTSLSAVRESYLTDPRGRAILHALRQIALDGRPIDIVTLIDHLTTHSLLDSAGGEPFIRSLASHLEAFDGHLDIIRDRANRRKLKEFNVMLSEVVDDLSMDPKEILSSLRDAVDVVVTSDPRKPDRDLTFKTLSEMIATKMDPLDCIIGDYLLAKGQALSIIGPGGSGKSRFNFQLAVATILSQPYVGIDTHGPNLRWLIIQVENGDRRMQTESAAIRRCLSDADLATVDANLLVHTLSSETDSLVSLDDPANQDRIARAIAHFQPDIIAFDPLNRFCVGDPNSDQDMSETCRIISRLSFAGNHNRAIIVIHHSLTGRAGGARALGADRSSYGRNSKTLFAWVRSQINIAPISEDDNETLAVACGKNNNGREFPPFAIRLNPDTLIYELSPDTDIETWKSDVTGRSPKPRMSPARVAQLCPTTGTSKAALAKLVQNDCGCVRSTAWDHVDKADRLKTILWNHMSESFLPA